MWWRLGYVLKFPKERVVAVFGDGPFGDMKSYVLNATASQSLNEVEALVGGIRSDEYILNRCACKCAEDEFFHTLKNIHRHELLAVTE